MAMAIGGAGLPLAGVQLTALGYGAFVSLLNRSRQAVADLSGETERAALASLQARKAFKSLAADQQQAAIAAVSHEHAVRRLSLSFGAVGGIATLVATGLLRLARSGREAADSLDAARRVAHQVALQSDILASAVDEAAASIKAQGIASETAYQQLTLLMGRQISAANAASLAAIAQDVAAVNAVKTTKAYDALTSSVANSSLTELKALRIAGSAEDAYKDYAATIGTYAKYLTEAEKRLAILNYVQLAGARFAGAYESTVGTLWHAQEKLAAAARNAAAAFGEALTPSIVKVLGVATFLLEQFQALPPSLRAGASSAAAAAASFLLLFAAITTLSPALQFLRRALVYVGTKGLPLVATGMTLVKAATAKATAGMSATGAAAGLLAKGSAAAASGLGTIALGAAAVVAAVAAVIIHTRLLAKLFDVLDQQAAKFRASLRPAEEATRQAHAHAAGLRAAAEELAQFHRTIARSVLKILQQDLESAETKAQRLRQELYSVSDALYALGQERTQLDQLIQPLEDALKRAEYQAERVIIPLQRQRRLLSQLSTEYSRALSQMDLALRQNQGYTELQKQQRDLILQTRPVRDALHEVADALWQIDQIELDLDAQLRPLQRTLSLARAEAELFVLPLTRARRELQALITALEDQAAALRRAFERSPEVLRLRSNIQATRDTVYDLRQELERVNDNLYDIGRAELGLNKLLHPLQDQLFLVSEAAKEVLIPMERRRRALRREIDLLKDIIAEEQGRSETIIDALRKRIELQKEIVDQARQLLEVTEHEIFMEDLRNRILRRAGSAVMLELESRRREQRDSLALEQERLRQLQDELRDQQALQEVQLAAANAQLEAAERQLKLLDRQMDLEEERTRFLREEIELAQARQRFDRLRIIQERRAAEEANALMQRRIDLEERSARAMERRVELMERELERELDLITERLEPLQEEVRLLDARIESANDYVRVLEEELAIARALQVATREGLQDERILQDMRQRGLQEMQTAIERHQEIVREAIEDIDFAYEQTRKALELQRDLLQLQMGYLDDVIGAERDRLTYLEENIRLMQALQGEDRLRIAQQERAAKEQEEALQRQMELNRRLQERLRDDLEQQEKALERIEDQLRRNLQEIDKQVAALVEANIEAEKQRRNAELIERVWQSVYFALGQNHRQLEQTKRVIEQMGEGLRNLFGPGGTLHEGIERALNALRDLGATQILPPLRSSPQGGTQSQSSVPTLSTQQMMAPVGRGTVVNNYNYVTTSGPSVQIDAQYANAQSPAEIGDDLRLIFQML